MLIALRSITAPDTLVFGYHRGDPVPAEVAQAWGLAIGVDVTDGPLEDVVPSGVPGRPDEGANRATWETYAIGHGMSTEDAAAASMEDLQAERDAKGKPVERPADNAKKADWVVYVKALGADTAWADADTTTRADLQAWHPDEPVAVTTEPAAAGDTVAIAAAEATKEA